jgi:hypothetical protein
MSDQQKPKVISRRRMVSLFGLAAAAGFGALTVSAAEAQTAEPAPKPEATGTNGMQRRQERRTGRHERRHSRQEHRHERRTGEKPAATAPAAAEPPK